MKTKNFKFKSMALVLFALVLSSNVWGETYTKVTSVADGVYLIVNEASGRVFNGVDAANGYEDCTISDGKITSDDFGAYEVTIAAIDGGYSLQLSASLGTDNKSKYIYGKSGSNSIQFGTTAVASTISIADGAATIENNSTYFCYNATSGNDRFRFYKNTTTGANYILPALYKKGASCTTMPTVSSSLSNTSSTTSSITATVGITNIGGCNITENGLVYSTTNPTPTVGGTGCSKETVAACGSTAANKTVTISGLACGQSYYVCGYATNDAGTRYSDVSQISTSACLVDHFIDNVQGTAQQDKQGNGYTIPSCGDKTKDTGCEGEHYKFIGWSKTQIQAGTQEKEPSGLLKAGETHDADDTTYYAVWAKEDE